MIATFGHGGDLAGRDDVDQPGIRQAIDVVVQPGDRDVEQFRELSDGTRLLQTPQDGATDGMGHLRHQVEVVEIASVGRCSDAVDRYPSVVVGCHADQPIFHMI